MQPYAFKASSVISLIFYTNVAVAKSASFVPYHSVESVASPHFYFGGKVGLSIFQDACSTGTLKCDEETLGYGFYGGYEITNWFALEASVTSYGTPKANYQMDNVSVDVIGGELAVKLSLPLTERAQIFTRMGGAYQDIDKKRSSTGTSSGNEWNILSALGISYQVNQHWSIRGEYQFIDGIGNNTLQQSDLHLTSVGFTYRFDLN